MAERASESREEWALMYRSGLTQAQIAVLCNMPRESINRSIGRSKRHDPSLQSGMWPTCQWKQLDRSQSRG